VADSAHFPPSNGGSPQSKSKARRKRPGEGSSV
jgi:hypothetical protein